MNNICEEKVDFEREVEGAYEIVSGEVSSLKKVTGGIIGMKNTNNRDGLKTVECGNMKNITGRGDAVKNCSPCAEVMKNNKSNDSEQGWTLVQKKSSKKEKVNDDGDKSHLTSINEILKKYGYEGRECVSKCGKWVVQEKTTKKEICEEQIIKKENKIEKEEEVAEEDVKYTSMYLKKIKKELRKEKKKENKINKNNKDCRPAVNPESSTTLKEKQFDNETINKIINVWKSDEKTKLFKIVSLIMKHGSSRRLFGKLFVKIKNEKEYKELLIAISYIAETRSKVLHTLIINEIKRFKEMRQKKMIKHHRDSRKTIRSEVKLYAQSGISDWFTNLLGGIAENVGGKFGKGLGDQIDVKIEEMSKKYVNELKNNTTDYSRIITEAVSKAAEMAQLPIKLKYQQSIIMQIFTTLIVVLSKAQLFVKSLVIASMGFTLTNVLELKKIEKFMEELNKGTVEDENEAQSSSPYSLIKSVVSVIVSLFSKRTVEEMKIDAIQATRVINATRLVSSAETFIKTAKNLWEFISKTVKENILGVVEHEIETAFTERFDVWFEKCERFQMVVTEDFKIVCQEEIFKKYSEKMELVKTIREGEDLLKIFSQDKRIPIKFLTLINGKLRELKKIATDFGVNAAECKEKHEPFVIYMYGNPGTGKSFLQQKVPLEVYNLMGESYDPAKEIYTRPEDSKYWDGYQGQKVHLFDDFFQSKFQDARFNALSALVNIVSRTPMNLQMAELSRKGNVYYSSEMVLISAQRKFTTHELEAYTESAGAVNRRIDVWAEVRVKKEFALPNGTLDRSKVEGFDKNIYLIDVKFRDGFFATNLEYDQVMHVLAAGMENKRETEFLQDQVSLIPSVQKNTKMVAMRELIKQKTTISHTDLAKSIMLAEYGEEDDDFPPEAEQENENGNGNNNEREFGLGNCSREEIEMLKEMCRISDMKDNFVVEFLRHGVRTGHSLSGTIVERLKSKFQAVKNRASEIKIQVQQSIWKFYPRNWSNWVKITFLVSGILAFVTLLAGISRQFSKRQEIKVEDINDYLKTESYDDIRNQSKPRNRFEVSKNIESYDEGRERKKGKNWIESYDDMKTTKQDRKRIECLDVQESESNRNSDEESEQQNDETFTTNNNENGDETSEREEISVLSDTDESFYSITELNDTSLTPTTHSHMCNKCGKRYVHTHTVSGTHVQAGFQCPHKDCEWFYGKSRKQKIRNNPTQSMVDSTVISSDKMNQYDTKVLAEVARDDVSMDVISACTKNLARFTFTSTNTYLHGFFVKGTICVLPKHGINLEADLDQVIEMRCPGSETFCFRLTDEGIEYKVIDDEDVMLICFSNKMQHPRVDISKYLQTVEDFSSIAGSGYLLQHTKHGYPILLPVTNIESGGSVEYTGDITKYICHRSYRYNADSRPGDCGSLLFAVDVKCRKKLLGYHICGSMFTGHSLILSRNKLEKWTGKLKNAQNGVESVVMELKQKFVRENFLADPNVEIVGQIPKNVVKYQPSETKVRKSLIHGMITEPTTKPALLSKTEEHDPLQKGIRKGFTTNYQFDSRIMEMCVQDMVNQISGYSDKTYLKENVLNNNELINGREADPWLSAIAMNTSPGYPWNYASGKGKERLIENELPFGKMVPELEDRMNCVIDKARRGIVPAMIFLDTLKDERRPIEKVDSGKTRVFSVGSLDAMLAIRKYYMGFVCHMMANHIYGECSVGLNVHSQEWEMMYRDLNEFGHEWVAGDYGAFDKKLPYPFLMAAVDVVNKVMGDGEENARIRENLMQGCVCGYRVARSVVYRTSHGMPSGVPITAVVNSLCNSLMFRYMFYEICLIQNNNDVAITDNLFREFNKLVKIKCYGDDHLVRVNKRVSYFNMYSLNKMFEIYGMEYTTTDKKNIRSEFVSLENVSYLKRKFLLVNGHVYAPLEEDSIYEMLNWIKKGENEAELTRDNIEMALMEWTHYQKERWTTEYKSIMEASRKANLKLGVYTYESCNLLLKQYCDLTSVISHNSRSQYASVTAACIKDAEQSYKAQVRPAGSKKIRIGTQSDVNDRPSQKKKNVPISINVNFKKSMKAQNGEEEVVLPDSVVATSARNVGLTNFVDQAPVNVNADSSSRSSALDVYELQTIKQFVERPYLISNFEWKTGDKGILKKISFPHILFKIKSLFEKLMNFRYIRSDIEIEIKINGTKFHYGKLLCSWVPKYLESNVLRYQNGAKWDFLDERTNSIYFAAGCRHVQMTPTANQSAIFDIGYQNHQLYVDLDQVTSPDVNEIDLAKNELGSLHIWVLNSLLCADPLNLNPVNVSIFARFKNVQLEGYDTCNRFYVANYPTITDTKNPPGATMLHPLLQGSVSTMYPTTDGGLAEQEEMMAQSGTEGSDQELSLFKFGGFMLIAFFLGIISDMFMFNKERKRRTEYRAQNGNEDNEQQKKSGSRIISKILATTATVTGGLSLIPNLAPLKIVSGIASAAGGIARYFGYQRPASIMNVQPRILNYPNYSHALGQDTANVIAMDPENKVGLCSEITGCEEKEMQLHHIINRPGLLWQTKMTRDMKMGTILCQIPVSPSCEPISDVMSYDKWYEVYATPLSQVARLFKYWRGTLQYKIQVVASSFHTGRVRISWLPMAISTKEEINDYILNGSNVVSHVMDIATDSEISFDVPFLRSVLYCNTNEDNCDQEDVCNGYIAISIVNTLASIDKAPPPIEFNIWVSGGSDMEFARLGNTEYEDVKVYTADDLPVPNYPKEFKKPAAPMIAQAGKDSDAEIENKISFGGKSTYENSIVMGEHFVHLKDIIGRPTHLCSGNLTNNNMLMVYGGSTLDAYRQSYLDYFKTMFRFWRGSVGYKVINYTKEMFVDVLLVDIGDRPASIANFTPRDGNIVMKNAEGFYKTLDAPYAQSEFIVPYYTNNVVSTCLTESLNVGYHGLHGVQIAGKSEVFVSSYCGDDFKFSNQTGVVRQFIPKLKWKAWSNPFLIK